MKRIVIVVVLFASTTVLAMGQPSRGIFFKKCRPIGVAPMTLCQEAEERAYEVQSKDLVPGPGGDATPKDKKVDAQVGRLINFATGQPVADVRIFVTSREDDEETDVRIIGIKDLILGFADKDVSTGYLGSGKVEFQISVAHKGQQPFVSIIAATPERCKALGHVAVERMPGKDGKVLRHIAILIPDTLTYRVERKLVTKK